MASTIAARCSGRSATTAPADRKTRSPRTASGYSGQLGFLIGAHALRATAATNALDHQADIAKVQEWLGHANIATTHLRSPSHPSGRQPDVQGRLLTKTPCPGGMPTR